MRIKEVINEEFSSRKSATMSTAFEYPQMTSANPYDMYRFSVAMADHTNPPPEGVLSNHGLTVAYTDEDEKIIKAAERITGHRGKLTAKRGSKEPEDTNTASPVAKKTKNKYGV
jgi:hypothetical protein